jgi:Putative MetA-pathway of phenol degradation
MRKCVILFVLFASASTALYAQSYYQSSSGFFDKWQARATATQALQPKWMVPVVSPYPMLIQVFRSDFTRQISPTHVTTWNLGTSRGLNLIPFARTEVDIFVPPYFEHSDKTPDGFGDFSFSGKFRILSANEKHGNYLLSTYVTATLPTGSYKNGATNATITPAITGGKGFGKFDAMVTIGSALPTGNTVTIGRTLAFNGVFQYHVQKYIWPELEINTTAWYGGTKDGKVQTFLTPGLMFGKYSFHGKDSTSRTGIAAGFAFQTAATTYHTYNHSLAYTGRFLF